MINIQHLLIWLVLEQQNSRTSSSTSTGDAQSEQGDIDKLLQSRYNIISSGNLASTTEIAGDCESVTDTVVRIARLK